MLLWLVAIVIIAVIVVVIFSRRSGGTKAKPPIRTTIVIERKGSDIVIHDPTPLCGKRGDHVLWSIQNGTGAAVDVRLPHFRNRDHPDAGDPLIGPPEGRRNHPDPAEIRDVIRGNAVLGFYKYDIVVKVVNDEYRLDPQLEIKDV